MDESKPFPGSAAVAVVGLGAWGSAALWRLAGHGVDVVGLEQFGLGHALGSSHGGSRMFRLACLEHPGLVPLARRSLTLWRELEALTGRALFEPTGGMLIGPPDSLVVTGTLAAAAQHDLRVQTWSAHEVGERFPPHASMGTDHLGVWEPSAGLLRPEDAIRAMADAAKSKGAQVFENTTVTSIELIDRGAVVQTTEGDLRVSQVLVTAGAWLGALVPDLKLDVVRMPMTWFRPEGRREPFELDRFPVFIRDLGDGSCLWGHGAEPGTDVKLGLEAGADGSGVIDPDTLDRSVSADDWGRLAEVLPTFIPGLAPRPSEVSVCMKTVSDDGQFLLGRPRSDPRLVIGGGCSGHGFKHATGIGEVLADVVLGREPSCPVGFTDVNRFL